MAQEVSPMPGDRVRVHVCERSAGIPCRHLVGSFVSWTPERITLRDSLGREVHITAGPRSVVETSRGTRSQLGRGLLYGLLGGAALGALATFACVQGADDSAGPCAAWVPLLAGAGTLVGGLVGAMSTSESWRSVSPPYALTIGLSDRGVRVGLSQSF